MNKSEQKKNVPTQSNLRAAQVARQSQCRGEAAVVVLAPARELAAELTTISAPKSLPDLNHLKRYGRVNVAPVNGIVTHTSTGAPHATSWQVAGGEYGHHIPKIYAREGSIRQLFLYHGTNIGH